MWRRGRWTVALVSLAVVLLAAFVSLRRAGAWAIVSAPNRAGAVDVAPPPADVTRVVRSEVGPPHAEFEAWVLDPPGPPRGTTLVLHGIRDHKRSMLGVGRALRERGLRAVLVDLRGHGGSSGQWLTYGVVERMDLAALVDQLDALSMLEGPLSVYGPSYGGAVALQYAARDPRVAAVVSLSTFASLREVVPPYAASALGALGALVPDVMLDAVVDEAGALAGFAPDAADTRDAIARTNARVLLVHGTADRQIPFAHARSLFAACPPGRCTLVPVRGGDHASTLSSARARELALEFVSAPPR